MTENMAGRGGGLAGLVAALEWIAHFDDTHMQTAMTLHYDMRGKARAALEAAAPAGTPDTSREALEAAEYALSHPESNQRFALVAVRAALATPPPQAPAILTFEDVKSCPALAGLSRAQADAIVELTNTRLAHPPTKSAYPRPCGLCPGQIESQADTEWHGLGNCVPICERCTGSGIEPAATQEPAGSAPSGSTRPNVYTTQEVSMGRRAKNCNCGETPCMCKMLEEEMKLEEAEQKEAETPQWNIEQILVYIWQCIGGEDSDPKEYPYSQFAESEGGKLLRAQMEGLAGSPRKVGEDGQPSKLRPTYYVRHPDDTFSVADPQPVKEFKAILQQRIKDILAARNEYEEGDTATSHCFHLMEVERILDGKSVGFGELARPSSAPVGEQRSGLVARWRERVSASKAASDLRVLTDYEIGRRDQLSDCADELDEAPNVTIDEAWVRKMLDEAYPAWATGFGAELPRGIARYLGSALRKGQICGIVYFTQGVC